MMNKKRTYIAGVAVSAMIGILALNKTVRAGYESAAYKVVESDGKYEVREYPDLMLVSTTTKIDAQGRDGSFMKLFRYISGANESDQKISMTTPVFMENDRADQEVQMGFVMPSDVAAKGVPVPTGADVDVRRRAGGRFAVLRFAGRLNSTLAKQNEVKLRAWMKLKGLVAADASVSAEPTIVTAEAPSAASAKTETSGVEAASYDPPYALGPWRRNEVLIRLK